MSYVLQSLLPVHLPCCLLYTVPHQWSGNGGMGLGSWQTVEPTHLHLDEQDGESAASQLNTVCVCACVCVCVCVCYMKNVTIGADKPAIQYMLVECYIYILRVCMWCVYNDARVYKLYMYMYISCVGGGCLLFGHTPAHSLSLHLVDGSRTHREERQQHLCLHDAVKRAKLV